MVAVLLFEFVTAAEGWSLGNRDSYKRTAGSQSPLLVVQLHSN